jgi:hypothetical protein
LVLLWHSKFNLELQIKEPPGSFFIECLKFAHKY